MPERDEFRPEKKTAGLIAHRIEKALRNVCIKQGIELAGIRNIRTKSLGSNNKRNVVSATIEGLSRVTTPEAVAKLRGVTVEELLS